MTVPFLIVMYFDHAATIIAEVTVSFPIVVCQIHQACLIRTMSTDRAKPQQNQQNRGQANNSKYFSKRCGNRPFSIL
jgi:hypothetical protein